MSTSSISGSSLPLSSSSIPLSGGNRLFCLQEEMISSGGTPVVLWARRRIAGMPGESRLLWHMSQDSGVSATQWDAGLLTGTLEEMESLRGVLIRLRESRGMGDSLVSVSPVSVSPVEGVEA